MDKIEPFSAKFQGSSQVDKAGRSRPNFFVSNEPRLDQGSSLLGPDHYQICMKN